MRLVDAVVVTCEHGGNRVPREFRALFVGCERLLASHRGWDPGALELAQRFAKTLRCPLAAATTTRLLVDLNRSVTNRAVFSEVSRRLPAAQRARVLKRHYYPHRATVVEALQAALQRSQVVLHLGVHSFAPVLRGQRRDADIGLLYDPGRSGERDFCRAWRRALAIAAPELRVRMNYPYRGTADGLTTALRGEFGADRYLGVELEVNQRFAARGREATWRRLMAVLLESLKAVLAPDGKRRTGSRERGTD